MLFQPTTSNQPNLQHGIDLRDEQSRLVEQPVRMGNAVEDLPRQKLQQPHHVATIAERLHRVVPAVDVLGRPWAVNATPVQLLHDFALALEEALVLRVERVGDLQHVPVGADRFEDWVLDGAAGRGGTI